MRRGAGQSLGSGEAGVGQRNCDYGWDGPAVGAALAAAARSVPAVVELARRVAEIPAPTFEEAERAADELPDRARAVDQDARSAARRDGHVTASRLPAGGASRGGPARAGAAVTPPSPSCR